MTVETKPTLKDIRRSVANGKGAFEIAIRNLQMAVNEAERDLITGYAGSTAIKHLREAAREAEKALTQLDTIVR